MKSKIILVIFLVVTIISALFINSVTVNYNLESYLPSNSEIKEGIDVYYNEFGETSNAYLSFNETSITNALEMKASLLEIENIDQVIYLDDYFNALTYGIIKSQLADAQQATLDAAVGTYLAMGLSYPEIFLNIMPYFPVENQVELQKIFDGFMTEDEMLLQIVFAKTSSDTLTETAVNEIRAVFEDAGYDIHVTGAAISTIFTRTTIEKEVLIITLICVPLVLMVLLILSKSYFDIVIFGLVVGVSIIVNLGTNILLPDISFITKSMAIVLQLAISLDYVIFYINAYHNERDKLTSVDESIELAKKKTRKPILASALTTGVSFLALAFMRFTIGVDIGIVFAKAILFSLLATVFLLPILIKIFSKIIDKTRKKAKMQYNYSFISKLNKFRYFFLVLLIAVLGVSVYYQSKTDYTYGSSSFAGSVGTEYQDDLDYITEEFGYNNSVIIILPKDNLDEAALYSSLSQLEYIDGLTAGVYYKSLIADPVVLNLVTEKLYSDNYAIVQFNLLSEVEGEDAFTKYENIESILDDLGIDNSYILGETSTAYHIKDTVSFDYNLVMVIALLAVMIIIFITFKNLFLPILLPLVIETSVFLTMTILSFITGEIIFLASLIVSAILLGVTIDYAILLGKSYLTARETHPRKESIKIGVQDALPSIIISATLFSIAGMTVFLMSSIQTISQIGLILGIGAIISLIIVVIILPQMLSIFDKWICKGNIKLGE
ncbi:MAG: MMPL family transporter [Tenericutes bacterium]|nr:MMPL family transporter [Mycoplasmatota bacterium]